VGHRQPGNLHLAFPGPTDRLIRRHSYPATNAGWAEEISLDVEMASAICPQCKILLVEAATASFANLGAAVNYAASERTWSATATAGPMHATRDTAAAASAVTAITTIRLLVFPPPRAYCA
jgi:hypothetical protein